MDEVILLRKIDNSIRELKRWKENRDRKTLERAVSQKAPLTSGALDRAIELLEESKKYINK